MTEEQAGRHLVVVQHGLWGKAENMNFMVSKLSERATQEGHDVVIVNSEVNELYLTYEGCDACGERLVQLVVDTCEEHARRGKPITRFSIIGYSMGGLMVRYAVGRLYALGALRVSAEAEQRQRKLLGRSVPPPLHPPPPALQAPPAGGNAGAGGKAGGGEEGGMVVRLPDSFRPLEPVNFVTVATPHLGTWSQPDSWYKRTFAWFVPQVAARSGTQFMLLDQHAWGRPVLVNMSDPELPFMQALATFPHLMMMGNTLYDNTVPYKTALVVEHNPYETHDALPIDAKYPSIVKPVPRPPAVSRCKSAARRREAAAAATNGTANGNGGNGAVEADERDVHVDIPAGGEAAGAGAQGGEGAGQTAEGVKRGQKRKGWYVRLIFLLFLPLTLPMALCLLAYMTHVGRKQWSSVLKKTFDHGWVEEAGTRVGLTPKPATPTTASTATPTPTAASATEGNGHAADLPSNGTAAAGLPEAAGLPVAPQDVSLSLKGTTTTIPTTTSSSSLSRSAFAAAAALPLAPPPAQAANGVAHSGASSDASPAHGATHHEELPLLCARAATYAPPAVSGAAAAPATHSKLRNGHSINHAEGLAALGAPNVGGGGVGGGGRLASKHGVLGALTGSAIALPAPYMHSTTVVQQTDGKGPGSNAGGRVTGSGAAGGAGMLRGPSLELTIDGDKELFVQDGLVTHGDEREAQEWMMRNLNLLPWNKVDVDTRHYHAHAAIILRMPKKFKDNADCMQYLADKLVMTTSAP